MDSNWQVSERGATIDKTSVFHSFFITEEQDCIGRKSGYSNDYEWFSYNQVSLFGFLKTKWRLKYWQTIFKMHSFGSGLVYIGCKPFNQTMVVLYGKNNFKVKKLNLSKNTWHLIMINLNSPWLLSLVAIITRLWWFPFMTPSRPVWFLRFCKKVCNAVHLFVKSLMIVCTVDPGVIVTDSNERAKQLMSIGRTQSLHSIIITSENIHQETLSYASSKGLQLYPFTEVEVTKNGFVKYLNKDKTLAFTATWFDESISS